MTHWATLGTDPRGNLTRIDNAIAQMPQRLEAAKAQLDNLYQQQASAKEKVGKPFLYEEELRSKNVRLVELDTLLNDNPETVRCGYALNSHPAALDGFIDLVREEQQRSRTQREKLEPSRPLVRDKLKQELPAHKSAAPKKREPER